MDKIFDERKAKALLKALREYEAQRDTFCDLREAAKSIAASPQAWRVSFEPDTGLMEKAGQLKEAEKWMWGGVEATSGLVQLIAEAVACQHQAVKIAKAVLEQMEAGDFSSLGPERKKADEQ